jgi:hypothetical protein
MALEHEERMIKLKQLDNLNSQEMRALVQEGAKHFKESWVKLAQALYGVHRDKLYEYWGYDKFELYVEKEVGIKKPMALKLLKTYAFVEEQEPQCLRAEFFTEKEVGTIPEFEAVNLLRMARGNKDLTKQDYQEVRRQVIDNGRDASLVRKDLTAMIKERKQVDPDEEREARRGWERRGPEQERKRVEVPRVELVVKRPGGHNPEEITSEGKERAAEGPLREIWALLPFLLAWSGPRAAQEGGKGGARTPCVCEPLASCPEQKQQDVEAEEASSEAL